MYGLTRVSNNRKVGPCATGSAPRGTCPTTCPFRKGQGCYAEQWPLNCHWNRLTAGTRGMSWSAFLEEVSLLPRDRCWRYGDIGDLPGRGCKLDSDKVHALALANQNRKGFCYTHYPMTGHKHAIHNQRAVSLANDGGFTINISTEGLAKAGKMFTLEVAPVATVLPRSMGDWRKTLTPTGTPVLRCPAEYRKSGPNRVQCFNCGGKKGPLCARPYRPFIIGFTAHGNRAKLVDAIIEETERTWTQ